MSSAATRKIFDVARRIPKVELHLHLDGSLSAKFIRQKCEELQLTFPVSTEGEETEVHKRLCKWIFDMKAHPEKMKPFLPHQAEQIGSMGLFDWMNQVRGQNGLRLQFHLLRALADLLLLHVF